MAMKCCTKLETAKERCPIVFQGHPSNFKVTRDKTSPILTQIRRFRTIGRSQLSNPSDLPCYCMSAVFQRSRKRKPRHWLKRPRCRSNSWWNDTEGPPRLPTHIYALKVGIDWVPSNLVRLYPMRDWFTSAQILRTYLKFRLTFYFFCLFIFSIWLTVLTFLVGFNKLESQIWIYFCYCLWAYTHHRRYTSVNIRMLIIKNIWIESQRCSCLVTWSCYR